MAAFFLICVSLVFVKHWKLAVALHIATGPWLLASHAYVLDHGRGRAPDFVATLGRMIRTRFLRATVLRIVHCIMLSVPVLVFPSLHLLWQTGRYGSTLLGALATALLLWWLETCIVFTPLLLADGKNLLHAFGSSAVAVHKNILITAVVALMSFTTMLSGACVCLVGLLMSIPVGHVLLHCAYAEIFQVPAITIP
eukprot:tig00021463_g21611.t1